jgi:hypothetical protein
LPAQIIARRTGSADIMLRKGMTVTGIPHDDSGPENPEIEGRIRFLLQFGSL